MAEANDCDVEPNGAGKEALIGEVIEVEDEGEETIADEEQNGYRRNPF